LTNLNPGECLAGAKYRLKIYEYFELARLRSVPFDPWFRVM